MKTKEELYGFVFGKPLSSLDVAESDLPSTSNTENVPAENNFPTEEQVIRHWMFCSDKTLKLLGNGDPAKVSRLGIKVNNSIITEVSEAVTKVWEKKSVEVCSSLEVFSRVKYLVTQKIESVKKSPTKDKVGEEWINKKLSEFQKVFNIKKSEVIESREIKTPKHFQDFLIPGAKKAKLDPSLSSESSSEEEFEESDESEDSSDDKSVVKANTNSYHDYSDAVEIGMRYGASDRLIAGIVNKAVGSTPAYKDDLKMKISKGKVRNTRKKIIKKHREKHSKTNRKRKWFLFDGRKDKVFRQKKKIENVSIYCGISDPPEYIDHVQPSNGKAPTLASEIYNVIVNTDSVDTIEGATVDACPTNVGGGDKMEGAIYFLEFFYLERNLQRSVGMLHLNELTIKHLMQKCFEFVTSGPYDFADSIGKKVKRLQNKLKPLCAFEIITTTVPLDLSSAFIRKGSDAEYAYKICLGISRGHLDKEIFTESFINRNPGNIGHARWLNTWNNIGRMYTQMTEPKNGKLNEMGLNHKQFMFVKRLVIFGLQVYIPNYFMIKKNWDMKDGPSNFLNMCKNAEKVCTESEFKVFKDVMIYNSYYCHSEAILYSAVAGSDADIRKRAVDIIEKIREKRNDDQLRKYILPREFINLNAENYFDMLNFDSLPEEHLSVPPLFRKIPTTDLKKFVTGEIQLEFFKIRCHNVDIERGVKATTEAAARASNHDDQQGFILATSKSRSEVPTDPKKSDY